MSRKSPAEFSELFDQSPTPKSPVELDKRIVDYARRNAPQPARKRQPLFFTAAATLSIAGIGLLLLLRSGDATLPVSQPQQAPLAAPAADWRTTQPDADAAMEKNDEMLATISRPAAEHAGRKRLLADSKKHTSAAANTDSASTQPPTQSKSPTREVSGRIRHQPPSMPGAPITGRAKTTVGNTSGAAAPASLEQATAQQALVVREDKAKPPTQHAKTKLRSEDVREWLRDIRKLHAEGKKSEAEKAYRKLRERCEDCDLPASLKRALENMDEVFKE